jgi:hypothetical protein
MGRIRKACWLFAAAMLMAAMSVPMGALASDGFSLTIEAPHTVFLGKKFHYTVKVHEPRGVEPDLAVYLNAGVKCKSTNAGEAKSKFGSTAFYAIPPPGSFSYRFTVTPRKRTGKRYICAYLVETGYPHAGRQDARASRAYVVEH